MSIRIINLILAIGALWLVSDLFAPALFRSNLQPPLGLLIALVLYFACAAWVCYAYHLTTLKWHQNMVACSRRVDSGFQ